MVTYSARDKFLLAKSTKNVLRDINFTNLKTPGGYIAKSKPQGICLQLIQTPEGDYIIWPIFFFLVIKFCKVILHYKDFFFFLVISYNLPYFEFLESLPRKVFQSGQR